MAVLIIGGGSAGRRHARLATKLGLGPVTLVSKSAPDGLVDTIARSFERVDLSEKWDFAIVASSASEHIAQIKALTAFGISVLVEKPLAVDFESAANLLAEPDVAGRIRVGYNLRFDRGFETLSHIVSENELGRALRIVAHVGQDIRLWRSGRDYRETVSASRALGGGVLLELSHEIDFLIRLAGSPVAVSGGTERVSALEIDVEDTADLDIRFDSGLRASLHLNMIQFPFRRTCEVIFSEGTAEWDLISRRVRSRKSGEDAWNLIWDGSNDSPDASYEAQLIAFSHFAGLPSDGKKNHGNSSLATPFEALMVLRVADACRRSGDEGRREIPIFI